MTATQRFVYIFALTLLVWVGGNQALYGQGKLGRVRDAVRHSKPESKPDRQQRQESKPPARPSSTNDRDRDHRRDDRNRDRRNRNRRNQNRNRNAGFGIGFNSFRPAPLRQVHVVHHPAPQVFQSVIVEQPIVVQEPVFVPQSFVPSPIIQQPMFEPPIPAAAVIGADYFDQVNDFDWAARISFFGGSDFEDIFTGNFAALFQSHRGIGLDTSVTFFRESGMDVRDHLYLGDVNLVFEPIANHNFRMRVGLGVNWLGDAYGGDAGFNMTSGFDWRLTNQWTITGEVDFGNVGETDLTHAQISLGRRIGQQTDWTFGYNHHNIGGVTIGSAFTGLQFRF